MKAIKVIVGLIYDDPWLVGGIVLALLVTKLLTAFDVTGFAAMIALVVLLFGAIFVSISREVAKKKVKA